MPVMTFTSAVYSWAGGSHSDRHQYLEISHRKTHGSRFLLDRNPLAWALPGTSWLVIQYVPGGTCRGLQGTPKELRSDRKYLSLVYQCNFIIAIKYVNMPIVLASAFEKNKRETSENWVCSGNFANIWIIIWIIICHKSHNGICQIDIDISSDVMSDITPGGVLQNKRVTVYGTCSFAFSRHPSRCLWAIIQPSIKSGTFA